MEFKNKFLQNNQGEILMTDKLTNLTIDLSCRSCGKKRTIIFLEIRCNIYCKCGKKISNKMEGNKIIEHHFSELVKTLFELDSLTKKIH